jgi:hypothetical protein
MHIPSVQPKETAFTQERRRRRWRAPAAALYSVVMILVGAELYKNDFFSGTLMPYVRGTWRWPLHKVKSFAVQPTQLVIDMKWESYQQLSYQREQALQKAMLLAQSDDFVPAKITVGDQTVNVKMRLKGDNVDHLRGEKWSFRVAAKGDYTVLGMKQFSLHHPRARNWMFEWLGHRLMRREDLIGLRYDFVDVVLNGKSLGIYALEEHFEKRLVENNARREGPILRFSEDSMWREINEIRRPFVGSETAGEGDYFAAESDGFGTKSALADPEAHALYRKGVQLLDLFRRGELPTGRAFDAPKLARYFALVDMLGGEHGARWHNIRFYYNPVSSLLEPIAFDLHAGQPTQSLAVFARVPPTQAGRLSVRHEAFQRTLFEDAEFRREYLTALDRFSEPDYLTQAWAALAPDLEQALAVLYKEFPYYEFSPRVLERNQQYIRSLLRPHKGLRAAWSTSDGQRAVLQLGNTQYLPLTVVGLEVDGRLIASPAAPVELGPRPLDRPVENQAVTFHGEGPLDSVDPMTVSVVYRVVGTRENIRAPVAGVVLLDDFLAGDFIRRPPNVEKFPFLIQDDATREIRWQPGQWSVTEPIIFPAGYTIRCGPGTELDLRESALVLSHSPMLFTGSPDAPIRIHSSDRTGQGVVVLQAGGSSELEYVVFEGLTNPDRGGWVLTGAVTFYESPVSLVYCRFSGIGAEDALNTIRSDFAVAHCTFSETSSDAFDSDFCTGTVRNSVFVRCRNDGIDASGSVVRISDVTVEESGDKGISSGEASRVTVSGFTAIKTRIGMASKDSSELLAEDVVLSDCQFGLVAFQKKPEFGPATLRSYRLKVSGVAEPYLIEERSIVTVDDRPIPANRDNIKDVLYGTTEAATAAVGR